MNSRRKRIEELLSEGEYTPSQLARIFGVKVSVIVEDLKHIAKSKKGEVYISPAKCRKCGFVFKPEVKIPKRCPKCKSEWIDEPQFRIISKNP